MKKFLLLIIIGVSVFLLTAYVGIQFIAQNTPNEEQHNSQDIVKVNVIEPKDEVEDVVVKTNTEILDVPIVRTFSLGYPVEGEIGMGYSPNELIYSKTLKEWTVHNGVDIQAKRGTPVKASEGGVVESVTEKADMGIEIVIAHENGYKTVYSNLSSKDMVSVGDAVSKGQVISGVGNTSGFEYYEPDHLHFEVLLNGKLVDPLEVLCSPAVQ